MPQFEVNENDMNKVIDDFPNDSKPTQKERDHIEYYEQFKMMLTEQVRKWKRLKTVTYPTVPQKLEENTIYDIFRLYWSFWNAEYTFLIEGLTKQLEADQKPESIDSDVNALALARGLKTLERQQFEQKISELQAHIQSLDEQLFCETDELADEIIVLESTLAQERADFEKFRSIDSQRFIEELNTVRETLSQQQHAYETLKQTSQNEIKGLRDTIKYLESKLIRESELKVKEIVTPSSEKSQIKTLHIKIAALESQLEKQEAFYLNKLKHKDRVSGDQQPACQQKVEDQAKRISLYRRRIIALLEEKSELEADNKNLQQSLQKERAIYDKSRRDRRHLLKDNQALRKKVDELEWIHQPSHDSYIPNTPGTRHYFFAPLTHPQKRSEDEDLRYRFT